jgi:polyketide-type polyunsaturated fatty acid synthase PfaA
VAIIGIGCLFPKANGPGAYWANVCNRVDAITDVPPTHWRPEDYFDPDPKAPDRVYAARGGFLTPVDFPPLEFGISPNTLEATDSTQLLGLLVARQALADAGYAPPRDFDRSRVGVILGVTGTLELVIPLGARLGHPHWRRALQEAGVPDEVAEKVVQRIADSYVGWQEDSFPGLLGNVAAGRIANRLDLGGTNCVVDAACASSLGAIHLALLEFQSGRADLVVSGGLDTFNDVFMYTCFCKTPALSPTGNARPFDKNADGTILGEGLGVLVLKRHADAVRDGDRVYALIRGIGSSSDGKGNAIYAPNPAGQAKALRQAYRLAGVTPDTIELVEAHGTGTRAGDAAEVAALTEVYRAGPRAGSWCALGSVKSQIGHTKAAAGVAGVIKAALSLHHKVLPPTIKVEQPIDAVAPGRTPFYVNTEKRPWLPAASHPRRAAVSAFGFGGSNFHCVLEENDPDKPVIDWDERYEILAVAADSHEEIHSRLEALNAGLSWEALKVEAARSRAEFSSDRLFRLVLVLEEGQDLAQTLETARTLLEKQRGRKTWSSPDRIYFGSGAPAGKLAFLFPGQGSQYVGMLRDLACRFPAMLQALADANFDTGAGQRLSDRIYPPPAFTDADRTAQEQALRATDVAQPALGAVSLGALRVLEHFGVAAEALAGHSYGELVALCAAGRIDATALHSLSQTRGRLMAGVAGDAGTMLAVQAPREQVEQVLRDQALELVVANRNAPRQFVLSGTKAAVGRAQETFARLNVPARLLPVAAAFHSPLVAAVQAPFLDLLAKVEIDPGAAPVFANTTGRQYPADAQDVRSLLAEQLARPVEFIEEIEAMFRAGVRTFLEVGPGQKLTGLVRSILDGKDHEAFSVDASAGKRAGALDLAAALAQLAALGHRAELARWLAGREPKPERTANRAALTIPICGANYVRPRPAAKPEKGPVMHDGKNGDGSATKNGEAQARPAVSRAISAAPRPAQAPAGDASAFAQALKATQDNLLALQKLGEQSAQLHRQFLDGQDKVLHAFQALLQQQQQMVLVSLGLARRRGDAASRGQGDSALEVEQRVPASPCPRVPASPCPQPPPTPQAEQLPSGSDFEHAKSVLLEVVAEKTGYPAEMLELDMELDSDLGIDSIKRVEIFSALQERLPEAPAVKPEHLGSLRTLRQVVDFLRQQTLTEPEPAAPPQNGHAPSVAPQASSRRDTGRWSRCSSRSSRKRRATPAKCWSSTWSSTPTWASTPSSAWRYFPRCKSRCPTRLRSSRNTSARCGRCARSLTSSPGRPRRMLRALKNHLMSLCKCRTANRLRKKQPIRCRRRSCRYNVSSWSCVTLTAAPRARPSPCPPVAKSG